MKLHYKKTKGCWSNSTGSFLYYPFIQLATSYGHWNLLIPINGYLIFNQYPYSHTTNRHVATLRNLLSEKEIEYIAVKSATNVQTINDVIAIKNEVEEMTLRINNPIEIVRLQELSTQLLKVIKQCC